MLILLLLVMNDLVSVLVSHKTFCIIQDGPEKHRFAIGEFCIISKHML